MTGLSTAEHADAIIASMRGPLPERVLALIGRAAIAGLLPARPGEPASSVADEHVTSVTWSCGPLRLHVSQDVGDDTMHAACYDSGTVAMTGERAADTYASRVALFVAYRADAAVWWSRFHHQWRAATAIDMPAAGDRWQGPSALRILDVVHVGSGPRGLRITGTIDDAPRAWAYEDYRAQVTGWHLLRRAGREVSP